MIVAPRTAAGTVAMVFGLIACDETFHYDVGTAQDAGLDGSGNGTSDAETGAPSPAGACVTDASCGGLLCHVPSGVCVDCLADADCSGALLRCEPTSHVCVACLNGPDCGKRRECDTVTHRCLDACFDADDPCPGSGFVCDDDRALCIECKTSANCAGNVNGALCDVPIGRCVECTGNAQCPAAKPVCDRRSGHCVGCVVSQTCGTGSVCDPTNLACRSR